MKSSVMEIIRSRLRNIVVTVSFLCANEYLVHQSDMMKMFSSKKLKSSSLTNLVSLYLGDHLIPPSDSLSVTWQDV